MPPRAEVTERVAGLPAMSWQSRRAELVSGAALAEAVSTLRRRFCVSSLLTAW